MSFLPTDSARRKEYPLHRGLLRYFPRACSEVSHLSYRASEQHGHAVMHWEHGKSNDHPDCIVRHLIDEICADIDRTSTSDIDRVDELTAVAWRALANLETFLIENNLTADKLRVLRAERNAERR